MRMLILAILLMAASCATKMRVPLNRLVSPESVGGEAIPEFELSTQEQASGKIDSSGSEPHPVNFTTKRSLGFFSALSLFETMDVTWKHVSDGPSLLGLRWQFAGNSLRQAGAGHSMAVTLAMGGNEHETEDSPKVEFKIGAWDFSLIHGYWFTPYWQFFDSLSYSKYTIDGHLSGDNAGDFGESGKLLALAVGSALVFNQVKLKFEMAYTKADWSESGKDTYTTYGLSLGYFF